MQSNEQRTCKACRYFHSMRSEYPCKLCELRTLSKKDLYQYNGTSGLYRSCDTCRHRYRSEFDAPCRNCRIKDTTKLDKFEKRL